MIYHLWFLLIFLVVLQYRVPAFGRSLTAIANLSADVGSASGKIALASANVSEVAAAFVIALTSNTMSMADEAWHGVDLLRAIDGERPFAAEHPHARLSSSEITLCLCALLSSASA